MKMCMLCLLAALAVFAGCENNSDTDADNGEGLPEFYIEPGAVTLGFADTNTLVIFEAVGGNPPFTWSMSAPELGTLSGTGGTGRLVNYTRSGTTEGANTLAVQDSKFWTAHATVIQDNSVGAPEKNASTNNP
ncbi:MAG: hypothetical protein JW951_07695 [Lentisphaerae bacterium]|nr:hypothetical protein [Lentisphaerota bacterium]